jgi:hypothetical protein
MFYIILRGWCDVLNVQAPVDDKRGDTRDRFSEDLEFPFDHFPKYHMKILLGYFNVKVGREDIFKPTIFIMIKGLVQYMQHEKPAKSTMFPHCKVHKCIWASPDGNGHNQIDHALINRRRQVYQTFNLYEEATVIMTPS